MAKPIPHIPGGFLIRIGARDNERSCNNGFALNCDPATAVPTAYEMATAVSLAWPTFADAVFATTYIGETVTVYDLSDAESVGVQIPLVAPGGIDGDAAIPGTVALLTHKTLVRKKLGYTKLGAVPFGFIEGPAFGALKDGSVTTYHDAWEVLISGLTTDVDLFPEGTASQAVLSYETNKLPDVRLINITGTLCGKDLSSLRPRRLRG